MHFLQTFNIRGTRFSHALFMDEDDRVELVVTETGKTLLTYTAHCEILDENGVQIGNFTVEDGFWVSYTGPERKRQVHRCDYTSYDALILSEIDYSREWLKTFNPVSVTESEGGHCD